MRDCVVGEVAKLRERLAEAKALLKAQNNSWAQVWGKWSKHPGLMAVGEEWRGKDGTYLAACALNDWIGRLLKEVEECASA